MKFAHVPDRPENLTAEWTRGAYQALTSRIPAAEAANAADAWLQLFADWNELKSYVDSEESRTNFRHTCDLRNVQTEEAWRVMREEIRPEMEKGDAELIAALLGSVHGTAISQRYGEQLLRVMRIQEPTLATVNSDLRVRDGALEDRYDKLIGSGEVLIGGETKTLARAQSLMSSDDGAVRREAFEAYYGWYVAQRDELASIFDEQVGIRDQMGQNLGHANFIPLGYAIMQRTDYGTEEAAIFRAAVREFAAPLFRDLAEEQARALGTKTLAPWDNGYHPNLNLAAGAAKPVSAQLDRFGRALQRLSPRISAHFERMRREGRIDFEERLGKVAGAYCITFSDEPGVAMLCNSTGAEQDIRTLSHEMGHAVQSWESQWIDAVDLHNPSSDACEIHSMALEFLCLPYLDEFFDPQQLATFSRARWRESVRVIVWVTLIDDFQHWLYENPRASVGERELEFVRLHSLYTPGVDWSGEAAQFRASSWYRIPHLFRLPFYSIDYAIAELGAMQFGMLDAVDHERCLETYLELCHLGGSLSLTGLLQASGLRSPFDESLIEDLMAHARARLT
ncbi:MAG: M3 family metallopeptidase [Planctomycetota bacterium]